MTIASEQSKVRYHGNGATRRFTVPFRFLRDADLHVVLRDEDGLERALAPGTDYVLLRDDDEYGGTCELIHPPQNREIVVIRRDPPIVQETVYEEGVPLSARARENALDLLTMFVQSNRERIDRSLQLPVSSPSANLTLPEPEARRALAWNADGTALENGPSVEDVGTAQSYAQQAQTSLSATETARDTAQAARDAAQTARDQALAAAVHEHALLTSRDAADSHPIAAITDLQSALDGKSDTAHGHAMADIGGVGTAAYRNVGIAPQTLPVVEANGKLDPRVLPDIPVMPFQEHRETFLASGTLTIPEGGRYCRIWGVGGGNYITSPNVDQWRYSSGGESTIGNLTFAPPLIRVAGTFTQKILEKERHKYNVAYCDLELPTSTGWDPLKLSDYFPNCPQEWVDAEICKSDMYRTQEVWLIIGYSVHDVWLEAGDYPVVIGAGADATRCTGGAITVEY
ncbi:Phage tail repeat like [Paucidesulfovibrio gracilis DSM 16080]|uniref:Phage tail repeat like n=1 Tax=Paucidesulfovibrio gracilis DSM 16080 TaxID=1121449 RepID=A0A1T4X9Q9_9BACT|nr:hypothetical protein [Paucidesulfovibrio gracilis]SKA85838.1 Phage tail repeat like [Paucidesulfovibrio gracilis DSM 16080]